MQKQLLSLAAAALMAGGAALTTTPASAMPVAGSAITENSAASHVENVRWRGRGWGVAAGILGGAIIGSAIANSYRYGPYYDGPYYPAYGPAPAPGYYADDAIGYCMSRFKSYDPRSGTYLGYDGYRHPCP